MGKTCVTARPRTTLGAGSNQDIFRSRAQGLGIVMIVFDSQRRRTVVRRPGVVLQDVAARASAGGAGRAAQALVERNAADR